jgi:hypothetical protein
VVEVTKCPPGKALGAGDLHRWASNRAGGRFGVKGQRDKDLKAWARDPSTVSRQGVALSHKAIRRRRNAERKAAQWAAIRAKRKQRKAERVVKRKVAMGEMVLWGDTWES